MKRTTQILLTLVISAGPCAALATSPPPPITATATASLPDEGPERLVDGFAGRPWIAPMDPSAPPTVTLDLGVERWVWQIRFIPGHARTTQTFERYARPARVRVAWDGGERVFDLHDRRARQALDLGHLAVTSRIALTIEDTFGPAENGVAIGDLMLVDRRDPTGLKMDFYQRMARYLDGLSDDDAYPRAQHYLVKFGDKAATPLARLVAGHDAKVARRALEALIDLGGDDARQVVAELLASHRDHALMALSALRTRPLSGFGEALLALAHAEDPAVMRAAYHALAATGSAAALEAVAAGLRLEAGVAREAAADALGSLPSEAALDVVRGLMRDRDPAIRERALAVLGPVAERDPAALAFLVKQARDGDGRVQVSALEVLARVPAPETRALLTELMRNGKPRVARAAVRAFLALDPEGEAYLSEHMDELRPAAIELAVALARDRKTAASTEFLVRALASGVWEPWYAHAAELLAMRHEDGVGAVVRWLVDHPRDERIVRHFLADQAPLAAQAAAEVLAQVRRSRAHTEVKLLLLEVLRDGGRQVGADIALAYYVDTALEVQVRRAGFDALTSVARGPQVEGLVMAGLDSPDAEVRRIAYMAVSKHHLEEALPRVQREISGTRPDEWSPGVVTAYGDLGGERAMETLREHYPVAPQSTRHAILETAWRSGSVRGIELLVDAVSSHDRDTRRYALALLEQQR
jgi:HEAT repeat protein